MFLAIRKSSATISPTRKKEEEIEQLSQTKKEKSAEYDILEKTQALLQKAKDTLDANYSEPMKRNFEKYASALSLVKDLAKEKQVLYFACHESRKA